MIKFTKICEYCGEEYWEKHECEGTRRAELERIAAAEKLADEARQFKYQVLLGEVNGKINEELSTVNATTPSKSIDLAFSHESDPVNHPKHYTSHPSGIECIDVTKHYNFQIGNAMKYLWRQGLKDEKGLDPVEKQIQDCEKAVWYIQSYINDLKGN